MSITPSSNTTGLPKLPKLVVVMGILELISGIGILVIVAWSLFGVMPLPQEGDILNLSIGGVLVHFIFLGILMVAAGIGLLQKKAWGWSLTVFYLSYFVFRSINAMFFIPWFAEQAGIVDYEIIQQQYIKHAGRIILGSLFIYYFYRDKVLTTFNLSFENKLGSLQGLASKAFLVFLFMATLSRLF